MLSRERCRFPFIIGIYISISSKKRSGESLRVLDGKKMGRKKKEKAKKALSVNQHRAILYLLRGDSVCEAARKCKVNRMTISHWFGNELFRNEFESRKKNILDSAYAELQLTLAQGVKTVKDLLNSKNESILLGTAKIIIRVCEAISERQDLTEKLKEIEEFLDRNNTQT